MATQRATFVGHATVRLDLDGGSLLTDPLLRERFLFARRVAVPPPPGTLDGLDAVLVSHLHMDHLDFPSIRGLDRDTPILVPAGGGRLVGRRGFRNVAELRAGDSIRIAGIEVEATPAEHDGRRWPVGRRVEALGYVVRGRTVAYFAGDTDLFDAMDQLHGAVDVAFLPVGGWGPRVGSGHLDGERAADAAARIRPAAVVPIHWGTYMRADLLGRVDLREEPPRRLEAALAARAPDVEARVLRPGESDDLSDLRRR